MEYFTRSFGISQILMLGVDKQQCNAHVAITVGVATWEHGEELDRVGLLVEVDVRAAI
jgi:hypothetical protein